VAENRSSIREAFREQGDRLRSLGFKPVFILLTATLIQIIAHFHTSRAAFRVMFGGIVAGNPFGELYEHCFWLIGDFLLQFPLLLLLIHLVLKETGSDYGIQTGNWRLGLKVSAILWFCMLPILWVVSAGTAFQQVHPAPGLAKTDWKFFAVYEVCSIVYVIGWEFIWRGYMLFGLKKYFGYYAVFIQMIPFTLLHFGSPEIETYAAMAAGVGLGLLAFATRSFWYGVLAHMLILGTIDVFGALRFRAGITGVGMVHLLDVISRNFCP